ncbi:Aklanonic acid methyl ester cyclase DnrD [subsurface metagenome]
MSAEENKAVLHRLAEEIFNKGNISVVDEIIAPDYVFHGPVGMEYKGPEGFKQMVTMYRNAFPDLHMTVEDMVAEGDKVAQRITIRGTHKGELMGIAPTGKQVTDTGIIIVRFAGGKEVEAWGITDLLGMMQQMGVAPPMG